MIVSACPSCSAPAAPDAAYCDACGARLGDRPQARLDLGPARTILVGRGAECDFQVDRPSVSTRHALLQITADGLILVQDLGSTNGVALNSPLQRCGDGLLRAQPGDTLYLGRSPVPIRAILEATAQARKASLIRQEIVEMRGSRTVFGRDPQCEHPVPHPMVSWHHAALSRQGDRFSIEDLGSTNGTFLKGRRIPAHTRVAVEQGEEISFGSYTFRLTGLGGIETRETGKEITVSAEDLTVHVPAEGGGTRELLGQVNLTIEPGDLVALMGPSGAGKTTLLCALNGTLAPSGGRVLYRNLDLREHFDQFRTLIGYVPQDDIMHAHLSVYQALYYTARLRLPSDYTDAQIDQRITSVLESVGMGDPALRHIQIGSPEQKKISGGQRKRVNLAMELLSEPAVMFLDEPTSGLSALDARRVVEELRKLAGQGRTVIVTIHQPSMEVYEQFNLLAMVSNHPPAANRPRVPGRLVYFGPALEAFDFFGCPPRKPPAPEQIEQSLLRRPVEDWVQAFDRSPVRKLYVLERLRKCGARRKPAPLPSLCKDRLRQGIILTRRLAQLKRRDAGQLIIALALPLVFGLLVTYSQQVDFTPALLDNYERFIQFGAKVGTAQFLMVVASVWFGCNNAVREIVGERAVFRRERLVNLSLLAYVGSKYAILGMLALAQCLAMLLIVYSGCGMQGSFAAELLTLWLASLAGTGLGLTLSAAFRSTEPAIASLPLALLPMIVLGGGLTTLAELERYQPLGYMADLLAPTRWAYEANFLVENDARGAEARLRCLIPEVEKARAEAAIRACQEAAAGRPAPPANPAEGNQPDLADKQFPSAGRHGYSASIRYLAAMGLFWCGGVFTMLKRSEWEWFQKLKAKWKVR